MLSFKKKQATLTVWLEGEVDHAAVEEIRGDMDVLIMDPSIKRLIFDFSSVEFLDSSGIGFVIGRYKLLRKRGGTVAIAGATGHAERILNMSGLYQIIEKLA